MIITAPPYTTMSLKDLKTELAGWDWMLEGAIRYGGPVEIVRQKRAECEAANKRCERARGRAAMSKQPTMDAKTLTALKGSIEKWRRIVDGTGVDGGTDDCPLCHLFAAEDRDCIGCPVSARAKRPGCANTPYVAWKRVASEDDGENLVATTSAAKVAARAELAFLESLLPTGETA